jgi:hypothetical protein
MVQLEVWVPDLTVYRAEYKGERKGSFLRGLHKALLESMNLY